VIFGGGTSEVGLRTLDRLAAAGSRQFLLIGRDQGRGNAAVDRATAAHPGIDARFEAVDLRDPAASVRVAGLAMGWWGAIDVLVTTLNSSAVPHLLHDFPIEEMAGVVTDQLVGVMHLTRAVIPHMRAAGSGSIVTVASDAAKVPTVGESVIGAAMAAIVMFSRTVAMEAKRDGIRVNCVTPSLVAGTGGYERTMSDPFSAKLFKKALAMAQLGITEPDDLAAMIAFLAGPDAARVTGQAISVNGGISAQ
jgi:NAD(P)-dependent dehydrogenase (short-subunit alcohol dehydrogenase family)